MILAAQLVLCTLAAYAFARFDFAGRDVAFPLVLVQLMIMPDVLIVENYRTMSRLGILDTLAGHRPALHGLGLRHLPAAPDLQDRAEGAGRGRARRRRRAAARCSGRSTCRWREPVYLAYGLVSVSYHWNNFLWPLIVTNSVQSRPLTVGLQVFSSVRPGRRLVHHHRRDA